MATRLRALLWAAPLLSAFALAACDKPAEKPAGDNAAEKVGTAEIAWRHGDVGDAFAEAAEQGKPVLLYWGAVWCPPCNRLKAGLFRDPEFVARTKDFIPVYLDGDSAGAQVWGERFKIKGYPTLIVLNPDRSEITRISGSGDPVQVAATLAAVHKGSRNTAELLKLAGTDASKLTADDWTRLAGYGGWQEEEQEGDRSAVLATLAKAAPSEPLKRQFALQAAAAQVQGKEPSAAVRQQVKAALEAVLANPAELRANRSTLTSGAVPIVATAAPVGPERARLSQQLVAALDGFGQDESLGLSDRLSPVGTEVALYRASAGKEAPLPPELKRKVQERVQRADAAATNPQERQALISTAARLLSQAGDSKGAEALLTAELKKSQSPYYYMPSLASLAEKRGDKAAAVDWLRQGYESSEGPASRVQWGVTYVEGLLRLTPGDKAGIEKAAAQVIGELSTQPEGYRQRTRQRLEGLGEALAKWSSSHDGAATLQRLQAKTDEACAAQKDSAVLSACRNWLKTA